MPLEPLPPEPDFASADEAAEDEAATDEALETALRAGPPEGRDWRERAYILIVLPDGSRLLHAALPDSKRRYSVRFGRAALYRAMSCPEGGLAKVPGQPRRRRD